MHPSAVAQDVARTGDLLAGRYRLGRQLAAHRSSEVWRARDEQLDRTVAAKHLDDYGKAAQEARAAAAVDHPGIVRTFDVVSDRSGGGWLIMENLSGASLAAVLQKVTRLCPQEVAYIGYHALESLDVLHASGLIHRDVKPSNLQLTADGRVVLIDFGLATTPCATGGATVSCIAGSLPYLAPEIVQHGQYGQASDLFALGMTLLTSVTGMSLNQLSSELLLPGSSRLGGIASTLGQHPALRSVIVGLLDRHVTHRMHSATALRLLKAHCAARPSP